MKLAILIPCLNEEKTITPVVLKIPKTFKGISSVEIFVVDDGSSDDTASLAAAAGAKVISHPHNLGLGVAFRTGIETALESGADVIVNMDGDGQFDPEDIHRLIAPVVEGRADFVTASRFKDRALIPVMPAIKLWGNRRISELVSMLVGERFSDVSCGFRAYSREAVMHLTLMGRYTYTQETFLEMAFRGFRILELPTKVRGEREFGKSRIANSIWRYAKNTSAIILRSYRDYRPFTFFGIPAAMCIIPAISLLVFFFAHFFTTGQFTGHLWAGFTGGALMLAGLILILLAVVSDMLVRIRRNQEELLYYEKSKRYAKTPDKKAQTPDDG